MPPLWVKLSLATQGFTSFGTHAGCKTRQAPCGNGRALTSGTVDRATWSAPGGGMALHFGKSWPIFESAAEAHAAVERPARRMHCAAPARGTRIIGRGR